MLPALVSALVFATATPAPVAVQRAVEKATPSGARVELLDYRPTRLEDCQVDKAELSRAVETSGRLAVKLAGRRGNGSACSGWAWVSVRALARVMVTSRAVRSGEPLEAAVTEEERELQAGHSYLRTLPAGAVSAASVKAGVVLEESQVRQPGPVPGEQVRVLARMGELEIEQDGRVFPCSGRQICVRLGSGKRVQGTWIQGRIVVEMSP